MPRAELAIMPPIRTLPGLTLAAAILAASPQPAEAQASFDCTKAKTAVEKAICADRNLGALDRKMAAAYGAALKRFDAATGRLIREDQQTAMQLRDWAFEFEDFDMAGFLESRVVQLDAYDAAPRAGFVGTWANVGGTATVEASPKGLSVAVTASDGAIGRWICQFEGIGRLDGAQMVVAEAPGSSDYEGWTLRVVRDGQSIRITAEKPAGFEGTPPYCGAVGSVDGTYIAAKPYTN
ncbi:lysozyme inhibitor LprI family protein [Prosthecodimorpha staleyi]|uniref:Uncharacterized protein n=1 Tax=Prosthecodimorpha staleyi TaxID=2840188 RepID=A0A947D5G2_9HYPH|nr:hypothetical protein [Prosthecodimorpha staleyi]MBT9290678.1 hypothetical protein [Prosthecodimorpha staleyi]